MAVQTFPFCGVGGVVVEYDVNDANWRVSQVRCINDSDYPAVAEIYESGTLRFTATAPAHQTTSWNVTGVQLAYDSVNGGIMMGNYTMFCRWPA